MEGIMVNNELTKTLDVISNWLEDKEISYLAKENLLVYYTTLTGRKSDLKWVKLTLTEAVRIIRATQMTTDTIKITPDMIVRVCQELDCVYEFGVKSNKQVTSNIFNYFEVAGIDLADKVMLLLAQECFSSSVEAVLYNSIVDVFNQILKALKEPRCGPQKRNRLVEKYFEELGYSLKINSQRVFIDGKKQKAIILPNKRPSEITNLTKDQENTITMRVVNQLK